MKLNPKQLKFAELYVETGNATQSYMEAGYACKKESASRVCASQLLTNPNVSAYITELKNKIAQESKITRDKLIAKNAEIAFSDINQVVHVRDGKLEFVADGVDLNCFDTLSSTNSKSSNSSKQGDSESESNSISVKRSERGKALAELARLIGAYDIDEANSKRDLAGTAAKILGAIAKVRPK